MNFRWFTSSTVRHATSMRKHVRNMLEAQRDILSPQAIENVSKGVEELNVATHAAMPKAELLKQMEKLDGVATKWLKPYPHASYRENIEVFLVALAVAMGIRTFFVQPFKIPTGSMQPTLYGVTSDNLMDKPDFVVPTGLARVREWFEGVSYIDVKAKADGEVTRIKSPVGIRIINFWQTIEIGGVAHTILMPPDYGSPQAGPIEQNSGLTAGTLEQRAGLPFRKTYRKGDQVIKMRVKAGDHLFVDRLTYNFCKPKRGEIVVFATSGIGAEQRRGPIGQWNMPADQFYIKRMVALRNERVQIGADHHLRINGLRLDHTTPHFENVYAETQASDDTDNPYMGHLPIHLFSDGQEVQVRSNHFMVMGDNTRNSLDSRFFGDVDADYIIGKQFFVYWPLTKRFGWSNR